MVGLASRSELAQCTKQRPLQASFVQSSKGETRVAALLLLLALTVHVPRARALVALSSVHVIAVSICACRHNRQHITRATAAAIVSAGIVARGTAWREGPSHLYTRRRHFTNYTAALRRPQRNRLDGRGRAAESRTCSRAQFRPATTFLAAEWCAVWLLDAKGAPIPQVSSSSRAQVHPCYFLLAATVIVDRFTTTPF